MLVVLVDTKLTVVTLMATVELTCLDPSLLSAMSIRFKISKHGLHLEDYVVVMTILMVMDRERVGPDRFEADWVVLDTIECQ
ncbi:hypothetical protein R6Q59_009484 [Mikania micrantha]